MRDDTATQTTTERPAGPDWPLILFFVLAYAIAWGLIPIMGAIASNAGLDDWVELSGMAEKLDFGSTELGVPNWLVFLMTRMQDWAFSIAGVIMLAALHGAAGLRELGGRLVRWRVGWRWWLVALLPFGLYGLATVAAGAFGSFTFSGESLVTILFGAGAGFVTILLFYGPMGEELGLRGFALPRLQSYTTPFRASVLIGLLWAAWHLPVLIGRDVVSIVAFLLLAFVLSFLFTWLFNGSGGSLLPVLVFHAAQNSEEIWEALFPDLVGSDWELISTLVLLVIGIVVAAVVWRKGRVAVTAN